MTTLTDFEFRGRQYRAALDSTNKTKAAWVLVQPHDKAPTWRRIRNVVTLLLLDAHLNPAPTCSACGQPLKGNLP